LLTYIFLHASPLHLFLNVYALAIFGNLLEKRMSKVQLFSLLFLGGIVAAISEVLSSSLLLENYPTLIGSSGAVCAILAGCVALSPESDVWIFFIKMKVRTALLIFLIFQALGILGIFSLEANTAYAAHIGALIFGYLYAKFFVK
ncbi:rhomboid family intramembrane serine protease, partial [Candidatus Micrarchaeota archaeon]|nr:rhomboid family intramembrane serine protease [Candidatus Micrarchaeota archaeon]